MPPARRLPVVPRPQAGELSGSYLARLAMANRTDPHTLIGLLGRVTAHVPADEQHLAIMVLTLNEAAFSRLLTYTGHVADRLVRAIPSLMPKTFKAPGELPAVLEPDLVGLQKQLKSVGNYGDSNQGVNVHPDLGSPQLNLGEGGHCLEASVDRNRRRAREQ